VRWSAVVMVIVAGLLASQSRGGVSAFALAALLLPSLASPRRTALGVALLVALVSSGSASGVTLRVQDAGHPGSRLDLWRDMLRWSRASPCSGRLERVRDRVPLVPDRLEDGVDRGGAQRLPADAPRRRPPRAVLVAGLLAVVFRGALARAARSPLDLGLLGALLGFALHELVDFNGQIPANAATWIALAALAIAPVRDPSHPGVLMRGGGTPRMTASVVLPASPRGGAARV